MTGNVRAKAGDHSRGSAASARLAQGLLKPLLNDDSEPALYQAYGHASHLAGDEVHAGIAYADRPTLSLVPIDDTEFTRKLFTPLTLDGVVYLVRTTWPIATVFRLYLENLNWVPNAELASGPTPRNAPDFADFLRGVTALQELFDGG